MNNKGNNQKPRSFWLKQMHTWHWVSSSICLICMLLFALTGITLNHAKFFESTINEQTSELKLPQKLFEQLQSITKSAVAEQTLTRLAFPQSLEHWVEKELNQELSLLSTQPQWNEFEIYFQRPMPGGDEWLSIDLVSGELVYMQTSRGAIAWLNDLHQGRNAGVAWMWFIDLFSIFTFIFCITGLILLKLHSKNRPSTWYVTASGVVIPAIIIGFMA